MEPAQIPDWYWTAGLHDAVIEDIGLERLDYDYTQRNPTRNVLSIRLNAEQALFDTAVRKIRLYNVKLNAKLDAKTFPDLTDFRGDWWVSDRLTLQNSKYCLEIQLANAKAGKTLSVSFDRAEVIRG